MQKDYETEREKKDRETGDRERERILTEGGNTNTGALVRPVKDLTQQSRMFWRRHKKLHIKRLFILHVTLRIYYRAAVMKRETQRAEKRS